MLRLGVRLLVVDTAAATFGGNELIRSQVTQFTRIALGRLALQMNGVVLMCAHPSRAGLASGEGDGASTAWNAGVRSRLYFARVDDDDGGEPDADRRVLTRKKANYAAAGDEIKLLWRNGVFRSDQPAVGIIGVIEKRTREHEVDEIFLSCLREIQARGQQAGDSIAARDRYAPKLFRTLPAGRKYSFKDFKLSMDRLLSAGKIRVASVRTPGRNYVSALVEVAADG